jgi:uncharacterized protein
VAHLDIDGDRLHLALAPRERLAALHGDITVPLRCVRSARASDEPFAELRGLRSPGLAWPRSRAMGTWRRRGAKSFAMLRRGQPAVVVDLAEGAGFDRLLVSTPEAEAVARRIDEARG